AVFPEIDAAGHGGRGGNAEVQDLAPESELVAHVLVNVAAGVVPEEAPVDEAVGIEVARRRSAEEAIPRDVRGRHVRIDGAGPLRFARGRVAMHAGVDRGDLPDRAALQIVEGVCDVARGTGLM